MAHLLPAHAQVEPNSEVLGIEACGQGMRVRFARVTELVTQLLEAREERQLSRTRAQLAPWSVERATTVGSAAFAGAGTGFGSSCAIGP